MSQDVKAMYRFFSDVLFRIRVNVRQINELGMAAVGARLSFKSISALTALICASSACVRAFMCARARACV